LVLLLVLISLNDNDYNYYVLVLLLDFVSKTRNSELMILMTDEMLTF